MVKYIVLRPVAVLTICLALLILGIFSINAIPVSLLPDVEAPKITVITNHSDYSARDVENNITKELRQAFTQLSGLEDMQTQSFDGLSKIDLIFEHSEDINLFYTKVNEKIDLAMNRLPNSVDKPYAVKSGVTDVPVVQLLITDMDASSDFFKVSQLCEAVIKKKMEQLESVAFVDISGAIKKEVIVEIKKNEIENFGLSLEMVSQALRDNNVSASSFKMQEGGYQYLYELSSTLEDIESIKKVHLNIGDRLILMEDIADVSIKKNENQGTISQGDKPGIVFSIRKKNNSRIATLKDEITEAIDELKMEYPNLKFTLFNDQSTLLSVALDNLFSSLIVGTLLAVLLVFLFFQSYIAPIVIAISMPLSIIISILFLYLMGISINMVSLSGLILGVGIMIDNSIIVVDNIQQQREKGYSRLYSNVKGTTEVISPLLTSMLTTCAVFLPIIFVGGISGSLFYDQAVSVSVGLMASLLVSIFVIPVIIFRFSGKKKSNRRFFYLKDVDGFYLKTHHFFKNKSKLIYALCAGFVLLGLIGLSQLEMAVLPKLSENDAVIRIKWEGNPSIEHNRELTEKLLSAAGIHDESICFHGKQQFLLNIDRFNLNNEVEVYVQTDSPDDLERIKKVLRAKSADFPDLKSMEIKAPTNLFNFMFPVADVKTSLIISKRDNTTVFEQDDLLAINALTKQDLTKEVPSQINQRIDVDFEKLLLYEVSYDNLVFFLKSHFNANSIGVLNIEETTLPLKITSDRVSTQDILQGAYIVNNNGVSIPLKEIVQFRTKADLQIIEGDENGSFISINLDQFPGSREQKISHLTESLEKSGKYTARIGGEIAESESLSSGYLWIIVVSLLLLYLILAAQFESLVQPLIILIEIPIDVGAALLLLWLCGQTLNIMSIIGIVVMSGVIVNDSILKIHAINENMKKHNVSIDEAIRLAGVSRFKSIVMTSLTTILALVPFLFMPGLGTDLQLPMSITIIAGMTIGTFVSLFLIPILYKKLKQ